MPLPTINPLQLAETYLDLIAEEGGSQTPSTLRHKDELQKLLAATNSEGYVANVGAVAKIVEDICANPPFSNDLQYKKESADLLIILKLDGALKAKIAKRKPS